MVTWNPGEILSARPTDSAPECGAPITKTGRVTLRALTMRRWRGGIDAVIGAGPVKALGGGGRDVWSCLGRNCSGLPSTVLAAPTTYADSVALLPRVVTVPVALGLAGVACCAGVAGCAQFNKALGQQQAMVYFKVS